MMRAYMCSNVELIHQRVLVLFLYRRESVILYQEAYAFLHQPHEQHYLLEEIIFKGYFKSQFSFEFLLHVF